jgi:hypothetical protein
MKLVKAWQMADGISHRGIFKADGTWLLDAIRLLGTEKHEKLVRIFKQREGNKARISLEST